MSPPDRPAPARPNRSDRTPTVRRRGFLALGAATATALLAGCTGDTGLSPGGSPTSGGDDTGTFRLLISDQPVAIGDFESLEVSFDRARVFRGEGDDEPPEETGTATLAGNETATASPTATANGTATTTANGTATATAVETEEPDDDGDDEPKGFSVIDLAGATVDLTEVVGDKALGVFDGELPAGRYTKIELYAADVEGIVDGEAVEVKIPSGKLQIVKPFEVVAGETVSFVFDINVVKKGGTGEYNLLPVISESGVAGEDVEVEEVGEAGGPDETETADEDADGGSGADGNESEDGEDGGPPSEAGEGQP